MTDLDRVGRSDGHGDTFVVDVQAEEMDAFAHGCWDLVHDGFAVAARKHGFDPAGGWAGRAAHADPRPLTFNAGSRPPLAPNAEP